MKLLDVTKLVSLISLKNEPMLEKWARLFRYEQSLVAVRVLLKRKKKIKLLDLGCGQDTLFYKYLEYHFPKDIHRIEYVGIDPLIEEKVLRKSKNKIIRTKYESYFKETSDTYDFISLFAVLEHVDDPKNLLAVLSQLLTKNGFIVGTTPSMLAKPVLELLSYQLGLISKREIDEHKNYFDNKKIQRIYHSAYKNKNNFYLYHTYFELGLNNLFVIGRN